MLTRKPLLAAGAAFTVCVSAFAADADHLNVQEPERPPYMQRKPGERFTLPPLAPDAAAAAPAPGPAALLERVVFRGNTVLAGTDLEAVAAPYLGKPASAAALEELRQKVSQLYVDRGYINSGALLAPDALAQGTLTLQIVEGRLQEVRLRGLDGLSEHYVVDRLVRDEALNIAKLGERFQLLLSDPLFARMNAQLLPASERGRAILNVDIERALPYQLSVYANNYQPVSVGAAAATVAGWVRNATGYGDLLEASYQVPMAGGEARRRAISWRTPVASHGTQIMLGYDRGTSSVVEQPARDLDIESRLTNYEVGIAQTVFEALTSKFSLGLNRVWRENRTYLLGQRFSFDPGQADGITKARDWRFWQEYTARSEDQVLALRSTFTFGKNNQDENLAFFGQQIDARYRIWLGQAQYARRLLDNGTQLILRYSLQRTHDRLLAMEGMSVGGVNTVRGYRENQLVRDRGAVTNVEIDFPVLADGESRLRLNVAPFYDYGRARNQGEESATIASFGIAGKLRWYGLGIDLAVAKQRRHTNTAIPDSSNLQDKGVHLQVSYSFF